MEGTCEYVLVTLGHSNTWASEDKKVHIETEPSDLVQP